MGKASILIFTAFLFAHCGGSHALTQAELAKLDARLQQLVTSEETPDETQYVVIIHSTSPDELRSAGVHVVDVFDDITIAKVTINELKHIVTVPSVRLVESNSTRSPQ